MPTYLFFPNIFIPLSSLQTTSNFPCMFQTPTIIPIPSPISTAHNNPSLPISNFPPTQILILFTSILVSTYSHSIEVNKQNLPLCSFPLLDFERFKGHLATALSLDISCSALFEISLISVATAGILYNSRYEVIQSLNNKRVLKWVT